MVRWLVSLDTDRVKEYVFATGRLREIKGASAILDHLNRVKTKELINNHNGSLIFAGGGSALASFATENEANAYKDEVVALYATETAAATITGILVDYDPAADFRDTFKRAARKLRSAKDAGRSMPGMLATGWMGRCQRCGEYPAIHHQSLPGGAEAGLCAACTLKRQAADNPAIGPAAHLRETGSEMWDKLDVPNELDGVGSKSTPANYIGFIYADGNGIGGFIENQLKTEDALRAFSKILEDSMLAAVDAAAGPAIGLRLPIVPVLIGGDDVILIVPAQIALPMAASLCVNFGNEIAVRIEQAIENKQLQFQGDPPQITMSAGVALAKTSYPIFALHELAKELQDSAKRQSADLSQKYGPQPTLDYRVITTSSANTWEKTRQLEMRLRQTGRNHLERWATARPYPCRRVEGLTRPTWPDIAESARQLRLNGFPRNKLQLWETILQNEFSLERTLLEVRMLQSRLSHENRALMDEVASRVFIDNQLDLFLTDPLDLSAAITPLPDIVELYDFLVPDVVALFNSEA